MAVNTFGADLIEAVCARATERAAAASPALDAFIRQYYHRVPAEDLAERDADDLAGAALSHWALLGEAVRGEALIRVYNPNAVTDGWSSRCTIVEIVWDDMPFIVDSVTMALSRLGYDIELVIHPVIRGRRDGAGRMVEVLEPHGSGDGTASAEGAGSDAGTVAHSVLHAEVVREPDDKRLRLLHATLEAVISDVQVVVEDWPAMRRRTLELAAELGQGRHPMGQAQAEEARAFLSWLADDNFVFVGFREYDLIEGEDGAALDVVPGSGLGILRAAPDRSSTHLGPGSLKLAHSGELLVLTKANSIATVHRPAYLDYVGVKRFDSHGEVCGEWRLLGLYTTTSYRLDVREVPLLRRKIDEVLERAGFPSGSHDFKCLIDFLETYPRDGLLQIAADDLLSTALGVLGIGERPRVRLFVHHDPLERFVNCMVTIPRDRYTTETRELVGAILREAFAGTDIDWSAQLTESVLARVHYVVHCADGIPGDYDLEQIEAALVKAVREWSEDLRVALTVQLGEERGSELHRLYEQAFPLGYRSVVPAGRAVRDVERLERVAAGDGPIVSLYEAAGAKDGGRRCKLYSDHRISLSDVLPTFEHMGAKVVDEQPHLITATKREPLWIYDFGLRFPECELEQVRGLFEQAFLDVWHGRLEDDGLNALVLRARIDSKQVTVVRAIAKYLRQAAIPYSDGYIVRALLRHAEVAQLLIELFFARLDPTRHSEARAEQLLSEIQRAIDAVASLDEDRILRSFLAVVCAILRTSCFREDDTYVGAGGEPGGRPYLSFKLDPELLPVLPRPRPRFEIFVYSPRFEGIHLRGGMVARGGLRWSDRPEDFRTEILGLMKAQMVKNALIVPVGSKGGFVLKRPPRDGGRQALTEEAITCYRLFLCGLLDLTDNIVAGEVQPPQKIVRHDGDDPYLVVAADKGTATFSDIANEVSAAYGYWLGDAFASGGSHGYDHKQMGITARGAWEAVKRHFRELGADIQSSDFAVVGVGDMSGDVFGNGMLLSRHVKLVGAFNHAHVFLDPNPDPERSFEERKRLAGLGRSAWSDYDPAAISPGGGVYEHTAKSIPISAEVRAAIGIEAHELPPAEVIQALLRAPVDLLWNGGIGTYVKAADETHADAGDKANDGVRVNGRELRCRVIGEGGNLGFTQRGRVEYALHGGRDGKGGRIDTDAIDNVAGVNCSDHEVNIKILLDSAVAAGKLSENERNELLGEMTDAVAEQVLYGSYTQTQALSVARAQAPEMVDVHGRLMRRLEQTVTLDRELEFLPDEETLGDRIAAHRGLLMPELAVLMAYCKIDLYEQLIASDLPEDPYLAHDLERYFPALLRERFSEQMRGHRLRREIIATVVANQLVDRTGSTFMFRLGEETGAPAALLARAYAAAREIYGMRAFWTAIEELDNEIDGAVQLRMLLSGRQLVERATRWLVHENPHRLDVAAAIERFEPVVRRLYEALPTLLKGAQRERFHEHEPSLRNAGVPAALAVQVAGMPAIAAALDIAGAVDSTGRDEDVVSNAYFRLGTELHFDWLRDRIFDLPRADRWQALARSALRDEVVALHRTLTEEVLRGAPAGAGGRAAVEAWAHANKPALDRCREMLSDVRASRKYDTTTLPVALREIRHLSRLPVSDAAA